MNKTQIDYLRKTNAIPFTIVDWLETLSPVIVDDHVGTMYKGCILAEDGYGKYAAIVGTTDKLLTTPADKFLNGTPYRILKIEQKIVPFCSRQTASGQQKHYPQTAMPAASKGLKN
ncbi:MAG TPA: hypothetical protein PKA10_18480 [Selenomonadales bacterium]|nr:hypothetical protein [Selenomonadales bacterium]